MHNKTYNKTGVTSKHSNQPAQTLSIVRILIYPSFDSQRLLKAYAISKDTDQTGQMIWVFAGCTSLIVGFVMHWLILNLAFCLNEQCRKKIT